MSNTLCLACSSSLPPSKSEASKLFITKCCNRPICPTCISSNPRLSRYDPCLVCLAGVGLLSSSSGAHSTVNLRGEEVNFVLGDDEDDETEIVGPVDTPIVKAFNDPTNVDELAQTDLSEEITSETLKYHLKRSDTLQSISLRFGLNMLEICKLNNLPPNIIRNPNLIHTRTFLILPQASKHPSESKSKGVERKRDESREAVLVRERAAKKLQTLTKEVDWRVAQVYVALADDEDEQAHKLKEARSSIGTVYSGSDLESLAVGRCLDDLEWEAEEIKAGRQPRPQKFPFGDFKSQANKEFGKRWESKWRSAGGPRISMS